MSDTPYHHGHLRDALLGAALALEPEHGPQGISLRQVARQAGVSHPAVYHHFADKQALLTAVAQRGFQRLCLELDIEFERAEDAFFGLIRLGTAYLRFSIDEPSMFRFMYAPVRAEDDPLAAEHEAVLARFRDAVRWAQRGEIIGGGPPERPAAQFWGLAHGLTSLTVNGALDGAPAGRRDRKSAAQRQRRAHDLVRASFVGLIFGMRGANSTWTPSAPGRNGVASRD